MGVYGGFLKFSLYELQPVFLVELMENERKRKWKMTWILIRVWGLRS